MSKLNLLLIIACVLVLSGCGIHPYMEDTPPPGYKEIRCTYVDGDWRYGLPLTNYVKGAVRMAKLTMYGDLPGGSAECNSADDGTVSVKMIENGYATDAVPD